MWGVRGEDVVLHTTLNWIAYYDNVDFALDSKKVVDQFKSNIEDNNVFGCIIYVCKNLFHNMFAPWLAQVAPGHASSHIYTMYRHVFGIL